LIAVLVAAKLANSPIIGPFGAAIYTRTGKYVGVVSVTSRGKLTHEHRIGDRLANSSVSGSELSLLKRLCREYNKNRGK
jgi:hypothetical protein